MHKTSLFWLYNLMTSQWKPSIGPLITAHYNFGFIPKYPLPKLFSRQPEMTSPIPAKTGPTEGVNGKPSESSVHHFLFLLHKWGGLDPFYYWALSSQTAQSMVAQKGHTCKLKMLLQIKYSTCKLKIVHAN